MPYEKSTQLNVLNEPACRHLLSKGMYVSGQIDPANDVVDSHQEPMDDGYCWCGRTQGQLGPDNELVERPLCNSTRGCYEPRT